MHVALARAAAVPAEFDDDLRLAVALRDRGVDATLAVWDDAAVDWDAFDLVIVRSTWDYDRRLGEFLAWTEAVGERLRNRPDVLRWNSDKHYLADLAAAGLPVVDTVFVDPGDRPPALEGEVVVKPAISAGARDTGRFGPATHAEARALVARLAGEGRTAMVQPYLPAVDTHGETALVFLGGALSHVLRKRAVLTPDEEAPVRRDAIGAAEVMYRDDLVGAGAATGRERATADRVVGHLVDRFGPVPLYVRVDLIPGPDGDPVVLEVEAVEPNLYLGTAPGGAEAFAGQIAREAGAAG
jgi:hypothetical protein